MFATILCSASSSTVAKCQCLRLTEEKLQHLQKILHFNNLPTFVEGKEEELLQTIAYSDGLLQGIFSPSKAPLLTSTFCYDCTHHIPTRFHTEGLDTHLVAVSLLAKAFAKDFFSQEKIREIFEEMTTICEREFITLCQMVGLFHDIGKPFVRNQISKKAEKHPIYIGHAQVGSRLVNQVNFSAAASAAAATAAEAANLSLAEDFLLIEKYKVSLEWAINHHMCSCTHMHEVKNYLPRIGMHLVMDLEANDTEENDDPLIKEHRILAYALLSVLSYADHLGRLSADLAELRETVTITEKEFKENECIELNDLNENVNPANQLVKNHSYDLFHQLLAFDPNDPLSPSQATLPEFNGKLIVIAYGFSGSGKSYTVQQLKEKFSGDYDVIHVERDRSLYRVYEKFFGSTEGKTYAEIYATVYSNPEPEEENAVTASTTATANHANPAVHTAHTLGNQTAKPSKMTVQEQWVQDIADGLETPQQKAGQIIILDSVQPLFPSQWQMTIKTLKNSSEEAYNAYINSPKIGYYSVPIHMFGDHIPNASSIISKTGKYFMMPSSEEDHIRGIFYPSIYTEKETVGRGGGVSSSLDESTDNIATSIANTPLLMDEQTLLYATGSVRLLSNYIQRYFAVQQLNLSRQIAFIQGGSGEDGEEAGKSTAAITQQQTVVTIFNQIQQQYHFTTFSEIFTIFIKAFLTMSKGHIPFIHYKIELENAEDQLISLIYEDGLQSFTGTTRDYRGEGILFHKPTAHSLSIRPSLPVFPEMASIQKDPKTFPYLFSIWEEIENFQNPLYQQIKRQITPKEDYHLYLIPKYDGSLFNCTFIHQSNSLLYERLHRLIEENERKIADSVTAPMNAAYYLYRDGIFLMGSKGTILSKNPVNERIHRAILGSYATMEDFLRITYEYVTQSNELFPLATSVITFHYEAIDAVPSPELTVFYEKAWCPYFGCSVYHQLTNRKTFHLPLNDYYPTNFQSIATIYDCGKDWKQVNQIYQENYEKLLAGDREMEPEGYVLHIFGSGGGSNTMTTEWLPVKYKYKLYYTAHKPQSKHHLEMAIELSSNPKYSFICQRLAKFRFKPSIQQILQDHSFIFQQIAAYLQETILKILKSSSSSSFQDLPAETTAVMKKDWALYWKEEANIAPLIVSLEEIQQALIVHYEQFQDLNINKFCFNFLMKYYDHLQLNQNIVLLKAIKGEDVLVFVQNYLLA